MNKLSVKRNHRVSLWIKPLSYGELLIIEKILKKHLKPVSYNVRIGRDHYIRGIPFSAGNNLYDSVKHARRKYFYLYAHLRTSTPNFDVRVRWFRISIYGDRRTNKGDMLARVDKSVKEVSYFLKRRKRIK